MYYFQDVVWGIAYEISAEDARDVREHLDFREKCGYETQTVLFHPNDDNIAPFQLEIYVGTPQNPHFLGPASLDVIANDIFKSRGPSGTNMEYLFNLASAVRSTLPADNDSHLFELDKRVKELCAASNKSTGVECGNTSGGAAVAPASSPASEHS